MTCSICSEQRVIYALLLHRRRGPHLGIPGQDDADDHQQDAYGQKGLQECCKQLCCLCIYVRKVSHSLQAICCISIAMQHPAHTRNASCMYDTCQ